MENNLFVLNLHLTPEEEEKASALLADHAPWGWKEEKKNGLLVYRVHFESLNRLDGVARFLQSQIPSLYYTHDFEKNFHWEENWKKFFTPINIDDRILVIPPWLTDTPFSGTTIVIDPKMAFGTGHHATTTLCLQAIHRELSSGRIKQGQSFLDLGTGSGILGIACAKFGLGGIGVDIESTAIDNARENIEINHVQNNFSVSKGNLSDIRGGDRFHLVLANILANPLIDMASELTQLLDPEKYCLVLSGILDSQTERVSRAYQECGLEAPQILKKDEWVALVWNG